MNGQAEQQSEWIISTNLVNNGWVIDNIPQKNVYFQKARPEHQAKLEIITKKKGYKKPDYILYQDSKPIGIIEAKAPGKPLKDAMKQAEEYAERLEAPLIFTSNGNYVETKHLITGKPLYINGDEVNHIIKYKEAVKFIEEGRNEIYTISKELIRSKGELIGIFKKVNDLLRKANVFSGYDRINEFSNILFLKLISEQQGEKSYWNAIKKQDDNLLFQTLNGTIIKELEDKFGGDVFSQTSIEKTSLFRQIMDMIDPLILSDIKTDIKGDAFEYFLKNMNQADNDLGQYFTPRHIVQYMVNLIDPKFGETIYDPFCGTGGFLIETFNYIKENTIIKTEEQKLLLNEKTLYGRDATKVATIAKKNMILHGDGHSNIEKIDSLENPIEGKYDCVITNIPFGLKDVEYSHLYYDGLARNNGDAMCVLHCLKSLKTGGRMALIVPEGFLFKTELKEFRERLLKEVDLELVVSLPQGIFQPYTGVKTDILYFTHAHDPQPQKNYYYFVVNNDGYTLNKKRARLSGVNDIHRLQSANLKRDPQDLLIKNGFNLIELEKVKENNYNLVGNAYQKTYEKSLYTFLPLGELIDFESGKRPKGGIGNHEEGAISLGGEQIHLNGSLDLTKIPYIPLDFYNNSHKGFVKNGDIIMCKDGALTGKTAYVDNLPQKEVMVNEHLYIIRAKEDVILQKYLFYVLHTKEVFNNIQRISQKSAQPGLNQSSLTSITIPVPSIEEQKRIVQELEEVEISITHAQYLIESLKIRGGGGGYSHLYGQNENSIVRLGDITHQITDGVHNTPQLGLTGIPILDGENISNFEIKEDNPKKFISKETDVFLSKRCKPQENDLLLTSRGSIGKLALVRKNQDFNIMGNMILIRVDKTKILPKFLLCLLDKEYENLNNLSRGTSQKGLYLNQIRDYQIPIPSFEIQEKIVEEFEEEISYLKQTENFIIRQRSKLNQRLSSLWDKDKS